MPFPTVVGRRDTADMTKPDVATLCPRCASPSVPIVYGLPAPELFAAADRGEVSLGGCLIVDDAPQFRCRGVGCGLEFA